MGIPYYINHSYQDDGVYRYLCLACKEHVDARSIRMTFCPSCGTRFQGVLEPIRHKRHYVASKPQPGWQVFYRDLDNDLCDEWQHLYRSKALRHVNGRWTPWDGPYRDLHPVPVAGWPWAEAMDNRRGIKFFFEWACAWAKEEYRSWGGVEVQLRYNDRPLWTRKIAQASV